MVAQKEEVKRKRAAKVVPKCNEITGKRCRAISYIRGSEGRIEVNACVCVASS